MTTCTNRRLAKRCQALGVSMLLAWLPLVARPAWACAVCRFGAEDPSLDAYFISVVFMSLVPVAMIGGGLFYIYRRTRSAGSSFSAPEDV